MEITISKACIFKDGRCHAVYTDGSGLILHSGGHYSTYFSPSGEIQRNLTLCTVGGVKSKILKLIKLVNTSLPWPISIFSEEIYKVSTHEAKITSATFTNPGHLKILSEAEELGSITIDPSKDSFLLIHQDSKGSLKFKSLEKNVSISLNPSKTLFKVTFPVLLPHRKPSWTENRASRVRLTYEYVTLTQIFHVSQIPETWKVVSGFLLKSAGVEDFLIEDFEDQSSEFQVALPTNSSGVVWSSDSVSPAVNIFSYFGAGLVWTWTPEATCYLSSRTSSLAVIHEDQSLLEANGDFFTHTREDNSIKFTVETIPPNVRSASYKLHPFVKDMREIQSLPEVIPKPAFSEDIESLEGVKFENEVENVGAFTAYNDRSIRVLFEDRTCIRIYSDFSVSAISRSGESARFSLENPYGFEIYIPVCIEFYNWAFLTPSEQGKRLQETAEREAIVQAELSRIERLSNRVPVVGISSDLQGIPENISQSLMEAQKQLQETRELLNKLNMNKE
jgi:hypothetical protein